MTAGSETETSRFVLGKHSFDAPRLESALYIVATPIGNLSDITVRALETLAAADLVACEDTRVTGILMQRFALKSRMLPYHEHNEDRQRPKILEILEGGGSVALVSDAGTPLVSDPGYRLVQDVLAEGYRVVPIPGASALLAGLVGAGLPSDTVLFAGFLPQKGGPKQTRLEALSAIDATLVFYESPRRVGATLQTMADCLGGDRAAVVARELTKRFETFERGTLAELAGRFADETPKGEIVVLVGPPTGTAEVAEDEVEALLRQALEDMPVSAAAKTVARQTGRDRGELYKRALELKDGS